MERKRKYELSALNVLFCLIVIFIHIMSYPVAKFQPGTLNYNLCMLPWRMSSFVVQGFILLSGLKLFLTQKDEMPYKKYLKLRIAGVILPYTLCYFIYYLALVIFYGYPLNVLFVLKSYITGDLISHLYFIPLLFQFDLLLPLWKKIINNIPAVVVIPVALIISAVFENFFPQFLSNLFPDFTFIYNDRLFTTYLGYWIAGCCIGKNYEAFSEILQRKFVITVSFFVLIFIANAGLSFLAYNEIVILPYINLFHMIYILTAFLFLFGVAQKYSEKLFEKCRFFNLLDKMSLNVYFYHMFVLFFVNKLLDIFGIVAQGPALVLRMGLVYPIVFALCIAYKRFTDKLNDKS